MNHETRVETLYEVCKPFPSRLKKAMFAAASHGLIKRRTWDGCAFNAAGVQVGNMEIDSYHKSFREFSLPQAAVERFISVWDSLKGTDEECTFALREALQKADLFIDPSRVKRVVRKRVFTSQATKEQLEFEAMVKDIKFDDDSELVSDIHDVVEMFAGQG